MDSGELAVTSGPRECISATMGDRGEVAVLEAAGDDKIDGTGPNAKKLQNASKMFGLLSHVPVDSSSESVGSWPL
jgi:hypothetical protein